MVFIEIGNSSVKALRIAKGEKHRLFRVELTEKDLLASHLQGLKKDELVLLSSVRQDLSGLVREKAGHVRLHEITKDRLGAIQIDYDTPDTLGIDRVIACAGAVEIAESDVIVIDAGTACTVDFMTKDYCFRGGVIMPGLPILMHSMKTLLPELPAVDQKIPGEFPGRSTKEAIQLGVNGGFIHSVVAFIQKYKRLNDGAKVLFTGGDGSFISKNLGPDYDGGFYENLVFDGMGAYMRINKISPE